MARARLGGKRLSFWMGLFVGLWGWSVLAWASGAAFGERDFVRTTAAPVVERASFGGGVGADYVLTVYNTGRHHQYAPVTAAVITVNGSTIFSPDDFKQQTPLLTRRLTFAASNTLTVELRSKPGSGLTIIIEPIQKPPYFTSTPVAQALEDGLYRYTAQATDPNGDPLAYSLASAPAGMQINAATGEVTWTPLNAQVGSQSVTVRVQDPSGLADEQSFVVQVANTNDAPVVTSTPVISVSEDQPYSYRVQASDEDLGDSLGFRLVTAPAGMQISATTGDITWSPGNDDVGTHVVVVRVQDANGGFADQSFTLTVVNVNDAPMITSTAPVTVDEDALYRYVVAASDVDAGDTLSYWLEIAPTGMHIDTVAGVITWTPVNAQVGDHEVRVVVRDAAGAEAVQTFTLSVANTNDVPEITSEPLLEASELSLYRYAVRATDVDAGDSLQFALLQAPAGMTLDANGLLDWTPDKLQGGQSYPVIVSVRDLAGAETQQSFMIAVANVNTAPVITSTPAITSLRMGELFHYAVVATDADQDTLSYRLQAAPAGMTIDAQTGEVRWQTDARSQSGSFSIVVDDGQGGEVTQVVTLELSQADMAPVITSAAVQRVLEGEGYQYPVTAIDPNVGDVLTYHLDAAPTGMTIDAATGLVTWTPDSQFLEGSASVGAQCLAAGNARNIDPVLKWRLPNRSVSVPVVAPVTDTNNDGHFDEKDVPTVLFMNGTFYYDRSPSTLIAASGTTGQILWTVNSPFTYNGVSLSLTPLGHIAVGDLEGDATPEILVRAWEGLVAFNHDGSVKWRSPYGGNTNSGVQIADIDGDGKAEIIGEGFVLNFDGTLRFSMEVNHVSSGNPLAVDLDLDGKLEIVTVKKAYRSNGTVYWSNPAGPTLGQVAVANMDSDPYPEIAVSGYGTNGSVLMVLEHNGVLKWTRNTHRSPGRPALADLNGDGLADAVVGSGDEFWAINGLTGDVLWSYPVFDGSAFTTPVLYDFTQDGIPEAVFHDQSNVYVVNGLTGKLEWSTPNGNATGTEGPTVADVDGDGHAEILMASDTDATQGVRAFGNKATGWAPTRKIRNQHGYISGATRDDLTTGLSADFWNRDNSFLTQPILWDADLRVSAPLLMSTDQGDVIEVNVLNRGKRRNQPAQARLYAYDAAGVKRLAGEVAVPAIDGNNSVVLEFAGADPGPDPRMLEVELILAGADCNSANNRARAAYVMIRVTDQTGLADTQAETVAITNQPSAPVMQTSTLPGAEGGKVYELNLSVANSEADEGLTYKLKKGPGSLRVAPREGRLYWAPATLEAGTYPVEIEVRNDSGASTVASYVLQATADRAPSLVTTALADAKTATPYAFQLQAADPDGDMLTYRWTNAPTPGGMYDTGLRVSASGLVTWGGPYILGTYPNQITTQTLNIEVSDGRGLTAVRQYVLTIVPKHIPEFTVTPSLTAEVGTQYFSNFDLGLIPGESTSLSFPDLPAGMSVLLFDNSKYYSGRYFRWTPTAAQAGQQKLTIRADTNLGATVIRTFLIDVKPGTPPTITSSPYPNAKAGRSWGYQMAATSPRGLALTYSLASGPAGMVASKAGLVAWMPSAAQVGTQPVSLNVTDGYYTVTQTFSLNVVAASVPLQATVTATADHVDPGQAVGIALSATGAGATVSYQLKANGQAVPVGADGKASYTPTVPGAYTLLATVSDGYETAQASKMLYVRDPSDTTAPAVSIQSPATVTTVTAPVDIVATITETNLQDYLVAISPAGKQQYTVIARGTTAVTNGVVGRFDPTLLTNGLWDLLVQATDLNGQTGSEKVTVRVKGDLKLGNFAFTVVDVEVPVAGIPIRVTRTYDTRRRNENLDFGHGWSVGYQDAKVEESRPLGQYWDLNQYRSGPLNSVVRYCVEPRGKPVVTVTLPTGQVETFEVTVTDPCALYVPVVDGLALTFTPIDNTLSTLAETNPMPLRLANGELVDNGTLERYDPSRYTLTTKAGYIYYLDQGFGLLKFQDPNGNTITYTPNGILHSSGLSVTFDRDSSGRISAIHDPDGNVRRYVYDGNGDLKSAVEPVAASSTTTSVPATSYLYYGEADGFPHYLQEIRDPLNRTLIKNLYDNNGRLIAQEDGAGHRVAFNHNLTGRTSVVTNRRGFSTQYAYDDEGRILTQIDALGQTTTNVWDARGNLLKKTNPAGEVTSATYSDRNDVLTQTDGEGHTTAYTYNQRGQELTVKDALGHQYSMSYDSVGNLLTLTDPQQHVVGNLIGPKGLLQKTTDALGNSTRWTYDDQGRKRTETDALGHVTSFSYDSNGNVLTETRTRTMNGQAVAEGVSHTYDSRNRETSTTDALGNTTRTEYDLAGNVSARVDALGHRTEMTYDAYGHLTQTKYPDGTTEASTYDAEGNQISSTDRLGRVTTYVYDALNRLIQTNLPD